MRVGLLAALLGLALPATAQQMSLEPLPALACLTGIDPQLAEPEYPFEAYKQQRHGSVTALLRFSAPDQPPRVVIEKAEGDDAFADAVRAHARTLRVPCLRPDDGEVSLRRVYQFKPDERRTEVGAPVDAGHERQMQLMECMTHPDRTATRRGTPNYPEAARRADAQGRILAMLRFKAPNAPPEVRVYHRRSARVFERPVRDWVHHFRVPCFEVGKDRPLEISQAFEFVLEGHSYGFKPLTLGTLIRHVRDVRQQTLHLDTRTMGCPFDLRLNYRRPDLPNDVGSVGEHMPAREPLLAWLRQIELDLPPQTLDSVYADTALITVPCALIDLKPQ